GVLCKLFHAAYDKNTKFRRVYQVVGLGCILLGGLFCFLPYGGKQEGQVGDLLGAGVPLLGVGLLFILFTLRHETEAAIRGWLQLILSVVGVIFAAIGLFYGSLMPSNASPNFLTPVGLVLALVGLVYLIAFVASRGL